MPNCLYLVLACVLLLSGCTQDLRFKIRFDAVSGLASGDALIFKDQAVGSVTGVESVPEGGELVAVAVSREHAGAATEYSRFYVGEDPQSQRKRIEIVQLQPGGKAVENGAIVQGSTRGPLSLFPFELIMKEFGNLLKDLRGQVEGFGKEVERLPDSQDAKNLREEWRKLLEQIQRAQGSAEDTLKNELLPKLQLEMETLRKKLEEMQRQPSGKRPLET